MTRHELLKSLDDLFRAAHAEGVSAVAAVIDTKPTEVGADVVGAVTPVGAVAASVEILQRMIVTPGCTCPSCESWRAVAKSMVASAAVSIQLQGHALVGTEPDRTLN